MHLGRRPARGEKVLALRAGRWSNPEIRMLRIVRALADRLARLIQSLRALGPYAAIALALPGGTLIVLAMLGLRHRAALGSLRPSVLVLMVAASIMIAGGT